MLKLRHTLRGECKMHTKPLFLLFEGLDLAGKSTIAKLFVTKSGDQWHIQHSKLIPCNELWTKVNLIKNTNRTTKEIGYLYYEALCYDIQYFEYPDTNTIQDSTVLLRSLAHHIAHGTEELPELFNDLAPYHPQFSKAYVFTATLTERKKRLTTRMVKQPTTVTRRDLTIVKNPNLFSRKETILIKYARKYFNAEVVDTTGKSPGQVVDRIIQAVYA